MGQALDGHGKDGQSRDGHAQDGLGKDAHADDGKAPAGIRFPLEFPCFGPSPDAVRATVAGLVRALEELGPGLRIGWVTDPSGREGPAAPASAGRAILTAPSWNADGWRSALADCDLVLTEGRPKPGSPGILILPDGSAIAPGVEAFQPGTDARGSLLAVVSPSSSHGLEGLAKLVLDRADAILAQVPLYGLVLGGGRSSRMRTDKASLKYHGKPQTEHCLDLLAAHCAQSFVSCRADQADQPGFAGLPQIHDTFLDMGPLGGILSALRAHRNAAFLVIACDLPFLDADSLAALVAGRDPFKVATAFAGPQGGLPEPLCAVYEPRCYPRALQLLGQGLSCPRKLILHSSSRILTAPDPRALHNANDPETYREAIQSLSS
jgi:molybdopterin-guanine dinucleotide biosynthesis protein A